MATSPGRPALDDEDKRRHQWVLRLNDAQHNILDDRAAVEEAPSRAWFLQACVAYTLAHVEPGRLGAEIDRIRAAVMAPDCSGRLRTPRGTGGA